MLIVLDANEYIFGLGARRERACEQLVGVIVRRTGRIAVRIPRLISENRHFLSRQADLPFRVLPAEQAIRLIS